METVIGIDFGDTKICVSCIVNGNIEIIPDHNGNRYMSHCISFHKDERTIGNPFTCSTNPSQLIEHIKYICDDDNDDRLYDYHDNKISVCMYEQNKVELSIEEIMGMIFSRIKKNANSFLHTEIKKAIISVPSYFTSKQRESIIISGKIGGLNIVKIINDNICTALFYHMKYIKNNDQYNERIGIIDIGSQSISSSIVSLEKNEITVIESDSDFGISGYRMVMNVVHYIIRDIKTNYMMDLSGHVRSLMKIKRAVEKSIHILSSISSTIIEIDGLVYDDTYKKTLTRELFAEINNSILFHQKNLIHNVIHNQEYDSLIVVGGCSRIPIIQENIMSICNKKISKTVNVDESIAIGLMYYINCLMKKSGITINDKISSSFSYKTKNIDEKTIEIKTSHFPCNVAFHILPDDHFWNIYENDELILSYKINGEIHTKLPMLLKIDSNRLIKIESESKSIQLQKINMITSSVDFQKYIINEIIYVEKDDLHQEKMNMMNLFEQKMFLYYDIENTLSHNDKYIINNIILWYETKKETLSLSDLKIKYDALNQLLSLDV